MSNSDYWVLVAVGEAADISPLLTLACAVAAAHNGGVTVLSVTPDGAPPDWLQVQDADVDVPVRTVVRSGTNVGEAIVQAARDIDPDLLLVGWSGAAGQRGFLLGRTLDRVTRHAPCDVAVVRLGELAQIRRALVPMSLGPNSPLALDLALSLGETIQVTALTVARAPLGETAEVAAYEQLQGVLQPWRGDLRVAAKVVRAPSVISGILDEAGSGYDLLLIGASNESYIDRKLFGNVPQTIAAEAPVPTLVVRRRASAWRMLLRRARQRLSDVQGELTTAQQVETYRQVHRGARARADFFVMTALAAAIATLGLLMDSPAVIIGAMVIAPLMSAILAISLGIVQGDARLLWRATKTTLLGAGLAVLIGGVISAAVPGEDLTPEILSRTRPLLFDLSVALLAGIAGAYAQCRRDVLSGVAGVAIAVALVPPLAAVGIGLAMLSWSVATGALLLFLTNLSAIVITGGLVFLFFGFRPDPGRRFRVFGRGMVGVIALLLAVSVILTILSLDSFQQTMLRREIQATLTTEIDAMDGVTLGTWELSRAGGDTVYLEVWLQATHELSASDARHFQLALAEHLQRPVALGLSVIPTTQLEPVAP
jgi:uncharacterized hydrophobic protein (TIGR00271 family)